MRYPVVCGSIANLEIIIRIIVKQLYGRKEIKNIHFEIIVLDTRVLGVRIKSCVGRCPVSSR